MLKTATGPVTKNSNAAIGFGLTSIKSNSVSSLLPMHLKLLDVSKIPAFSNTISGFNSVDDAGMPPSKVHSELSTIPVKYFQIGLLKVHSLLQQRPKTCKWRNKYRYNLSACI